VQAEILTKKKFSVFKGFIPDFAAIRYNS